MNQGELSRDSSPWFMRMRLEGAEDEFDRAGLEGAEDEFVGAGVRGD